MFDPMTTEAARIERNQAIACAHAYGTAVPMRPGLVARFVARFRSTAPAAPVAPIVALPTMAPDTTATTAKPAAAA